MQQFIKSGKRILFNTPFTGRGRGTTRFPAQNDEYIVVSPDAGGTLITVHKSEIISVL